MRFSIGQKLSVLIGVLLALFVGVGLTAYDGLRMINKQVRKVLEVEQPTSAAAYEMERNLLSIMGCVLSYLEDHDAAHFDHIRDSRAEFQQAQAVYGSFAETEQGKALGQEAVRLFTEFNTLADAILANTNAQQQTSARLLASIDAWEVLLDDEIEPGIASKINTDAVLAFQYRHILAEIESALDESQRFVNTYLFANDASYLDRFKEHLVAFDDAVTQYAALGLSPQERQQIEHLRTLAETTRALSENVIALAQQRRADVAQLIDLRVRLGTTLLHKEVVKGIAEKDLVESGDRAIQAVKTANRNMLIFVSGGMVFGIGFGLLFGRNITGPLKQLVQAASQIAVGDLSTNIMVKNRDEFGRLASAFQSMIAYIRNVARVAETISTGDVQVEVVPQSERDVLNISLQRMIAYIQNIAAITERISNKELQVEAAPQSEHDVLNHALQKMLVNLRTMIQAIEQQNWLQQGLNQLNSDLLGEESLLEVCNKAIRFVARYVNAGSGVLYVYDADAQILKLYSSFAFIERERVSNQYRLGEGVVGQVALEKSPILLKHIRREQALITTGTTSHAPLNTYTFPLLYNRDLYGVLELASFEPFDEAKQRFLNETNQAIATAIFSTRQRERVQQLLRVSQDAQTAAEQAAHEAELAKNEAERQAAEVHKANVRLQEQQHELQQQSEELQQVNAHLEEQQQRLHQQSEELRQQNENLQEAQAALDQRARDLELASKYKSEFLANMSHELRTPLNSIILLSKMLSRNDKGNLTDKEIKQANVIHQAGEELLRLINDILDLSKIEAGKVILHPTKFASESLLDTFRDLFHSVAEEKKLQFIIEDRFNANLTTDQDKLSQVIRNLLANAFKFTRQGSVSLLLDPVPGRSAFVQIAVVDTGIGIPKDKQKLVFEAFQQADGSTSREFGGTGLGLSIAREYSKLLGGVLALDSEPGVGTTFTVTIPMVLPEKPTTDQFGAVSTPPVPPRARPTPAASSITRPESAVTTVEDDREQIAPGDKVILIIEDNADLAENTLEVTRKMGFKSLVALNGQAGLELAARFRPTGILLDLVLPDMNGMEILRELKSTRELRHIPVHIMSSRERDNSYRNAGAVGYFQKPVNEIDIQHAIENLLSISEKSSRRLLIVEDDATQREAIRDFLGDDAEVDITGVGSVDEAIPEIEKGGYDAAIIDLGLQGGSGYDLCKYIKLHHLVLPVIIYTGRDLTEDEERELRQYTDSIIIKTARSYERLSDEVSVFLHKVYHGEPVAPSQAAAPKKLAAAGGLEGKKILVVDDDLKNIFVLASALENNGATVIDAQNGQTALDLLRATNDIDLVLMDIMMPVMDGYAAIQEIRKDPKLKHLPVIALTAKALKGDQQKCIQAGADDYLSKPVDYDGLIRLAKAWIEKG